MCPCLWKTASVSSSLRVLPCLIVVLNTHLPSWFVASFNEAIVTGHWHCSQISWIQWMNGWYNPCWWMCTGALMQPLLHDWCWITPVQVSILRSLTWWSFHPVTLSVQSVVLIMKTSSLLMSPLALLLASFVSKMVLTMQAYTLYVLWLWIMALSFFPSAVMVF